MVEILVTQQEAKEMREALNLLDQTEAQATKVQFDANMAITQAWYNTVEKPVPTTRQQALDKFNHIKSLLETETNKYKITLLHIKLQEANKKYIEVKANG